MLIFQREFSIGFIWLKWNKTPELYITYSIFLCVCVCVRPLVTLRWWPWTSSWTGVAAAAWT